MKNFQHVDFQCFVQFRVIDNILNWNQFFRRFNDFFLFFCEQRTNKALRFFVRIARKFVCLKFTLLMIDFREFANMNDRSICSKKNEYYFHLLHVFLTYRNQKLNDIFVKNSRLKSNRFSYWKLNNQILYKIHFCFTHTRRNQWRQQFYHFSIVFCQRNIVILISIDR